MPSANVKYFDVDFMAMTCYVISNVDFHKQPSLHKQYCKQIVCQTKSLPEKHRPVNGFASCE